MKKILLFAAMSAMLALGATAAIDGQQYDAVNGINIANQWVVDRIHNGGQFPAMDACNARARTAVMAGDIIYVARSEAKTIIQGTDTLGSASVIYRFKVEDGTELPPLDVTLDGQPYMTFLGVNSIGVDNFGHVWVAPYTSEAEGSVSVPFYSLEAGCTIMSAAANSATVYRWYVAQGDSFEYVEGGFDGDTYLDIVDFYPETVTQWAYGPTVKMCYDPNADDPYAGELFYVDGFNGAPALYDVTGTLIDSFDGVDPALAPYEVGANGCAEFTLDDRNSLVYTMAQYSGTTDAGLMRACQANICELGEGMSIPGMQLYWTIPANGLGEVSDGGNRVHCFNVQYGEEGGEPCVTLFTYKCYNGMAVYMIGKGVTPNEPVVGITGDVTGNDVVDIADVNAVINIMLGKAAMVPAADVTGNGSVDIADVNAVINIMLGK